MAQKLPLPADLMRLMEKRETTDRRKQQRRKAPASASGPPVAPSAPIARPQNSIPLFIAEQVVNEVTSSGDAPDAANPARRKRADRRVSPRRTTDKKSNKK